MSETELVTVVTHPLVASKLLQMRKPIAQCPQRQFTRLLRELGGHMAYEVAPALPLRRERVDVIRGEEQAEGMSLALDRLILVEILRSGVPMAEGFREVLTVPTVAHIGIHVDKTSGKTAEYLVSLPEEAVTERIFIIVDPIIATGGTACTALRQIAPLRPAGIIYVSLIASPPGCAAIYANYPGVRIYCAARDELSGGRVIPGLGSISERLFGFRTVTVH